MTRPARSCLVARAVIPSIEPAVCPCADLPEHAEAQPPLNPQADAGQVAPLGPDGAPRQPALGSATRVVTTLPCPSGNLVAFWVQFGCFICLSIIIRFLTVSCL